MSDLSEFLKFEDAAGLRDAYAQAMAAFAVPEPMLLSEWMAEHFYLSAESSYGESRWEAWPFQLAIANCMGHDDIVETDMMKSARVGATKILLADVCYNAHHKRRNQALWQPTDDDRDQFVKTELDPVLRDIEVMREVMPHAVSRHKDNTMQQKKFLGSMLHTLGGKAAKNYRRISIDTGNVDEIDGFDRDIEKEGDPRYLVFKRVSGATFPKLNIASTPTLRGFSLIEDSVALAEKVFRFHIPCPHCGGFHPILWGGKDEPHGFKWDDREPATVRHVCPHCGGTIKQGDYLAVAMQGRYQSDDGYIITHRAEFFDPDGNAIKPFRHIAFVDVWTALAPNVSWESIVREFLGAIEKFEAGDSTKLKAFTNLTLGRTWGGDVESTDASELQARAEPYPLGIVPAGGLLLLAGVDTQDNRLEVGVWAYGRGCEAWPVAHQVFFGNPAEDAVWGELDDYLFNTEFPHAVGGPLRIHAAAIDSGGHNTHAVYEFARIHKHRRVFATKGRSGTEKAIKDGGSAVDIDWRGRKRKAGVILWQVGTNHAKDLLHNRLAIQRPGPGYVHFSSELSDEWFAQYTSEVRASRETATGTQSRWTKIRRRNEVLDCAVGVVWLEQHFEYHRKSDKWWDELESRVQPVVRDLFAAPPDAPAPPPKSRQPSAGISVSTVMAARK